MRINFSVFVFLINFLGAPAFGAATGFAAQCSQIFQSDSTKASALIHRYNALLSLLVEREPRAVNANFYATEWTCRGGQCMTMSAQLTIALAALGMPVERAGVNSLSKQADPNLPRFGGFHFFVVDRSIPEVEIIIDPTYKQFFDGNIPEPEIFVGTREELASLFVRYRHLIKLQDGSDPTGLDPSGVAETYYGFGRVEKNRYNRPSRIQP